MESDGSLKARGILKSANLYSTQCRREILEVLLRTERPLTQEQIAVEVGAGKFNKASIYRTLTSLLDAGVVHRAFLDERAWHFELSHNCTEQQCHPHFTCTKCGATHCLTGMTIPMAAGSPGGFVIHRQQVHLEGHCPECA